MNNPVPGACPPEPVRYVGLDVHKHYLVAYAVDDEQERVYGPRRVGYERLNLSAP